MILLKLLVVHFSFCVAHHLTDLNLSAVESHIRAFQDKIKDEQNEGKYIYSMPNKSFLI